MTLICFHSTGLILGLCPANERRRYFVTTYLIGWAQALANPITSAVSRHPPDTWTQELLCGPLCASQGHGFTEHSELLCSHLFRYCWKWGCLKCNVGNFWLNRNPPLAWYKNYIRKLCTGLKNPQRIPNTGILMFARPQPCMIPCDQPAPCMCLNSFQSSSWLSLSTNITMTS